jgi:rRNA maturation protein Nop10
MKNEYFIWIVDEKTSMTSSEPLTPDSKGFGFVVTEPMEKHPEGFKLALCLKAESELSAVKMFRMYIDGHSLISTHCMKCEHGDFYVGDEYTDDLPESCPVCGEHKEFSYFTLPEFIPPAYNGKII